MAFIRYNFESKYLGNNTEVGIVLPDMLRTDDPHKWYGSGQKFKVLWLLHGTYGDYSDWFRRTMIEVFARERNLIVVSPSAMNSNYSNWPSFATGYMMYDFLTEELMPLIYNWFPASDKREDNFIMGLSMGGRGTCVYAFNHPEKFAGAAILSAFPHDLKAEYEENAPMWARMGKEAINYNSVEEFVTGYENTMQKLRDNVKNGVDMPKLFFGCGEADPLFVGWKAFQKEAVEDLKIDAMWHSIPELKHEWKYWNAAIEPALEYFGLHKCRGVNPF